MFRIRAVESPADKASGLRTVWHRGALHAELVSEIDTEGRAVRHELSLFDDVFVWERGRGFTTGAARAEGSTRGAANVAFDLTTDPERLARACDALRPYAGVDRILLHLRELLIAGEQGRAPTEDLGAVTNPRLAPVTLPEPTEAPLTPRVLPWLLLGLGLVALGLALLLSK